MVIHLMGILFNSTLKDHKREFESNPEIRLINPSRSDIGRISKKILDRVIPILSETIKLHLWGSTGSVIDWFKGLENKDEYKFIQWDISSYYPTISPILLDKALLLATGRAGLKRNEVDVILKL